jgi:hypothetical protein
MTSFVRVNTSTGTSAFIFLRNTNWAEYEGTKCDCGGGGGRSVALSNASQLSVENAQWGRGRGVGRLLKF